MDPSVGESPLKSKTSAFLITPSDSTDLPIYTDGFHVSATGTVTVDFIGGATGVALGTLPVGYYPYGVRRVHSTGTSATVIGVY